MALNRPEKGHVYGVRAGTTLFYLSLKRVWQAKILFFFFFFATLLCLEMIGESRVSNAFKFTCELL